MVTGDRTVGPVVADAMISGIEYEVRISDKLGAELGIVILDLCSISICASTTLRAYPRSASPEAYGH